MEDSQIIELYWRRDESAIAETERKYGPFLQKIALDLLSSRPDAEECVNDTYHRAWTSIPPERPARLRAFLGVIVRNIAINRWREGRAKKRGGLTQMLSELEESIPSPQTVERAMESAELGAVISRWLRSLSDGDRLLFVRRYWYGVTLRDLAREHGIPYGQLTQRMYRLRHSLKAALEKEEISL